MAYLDGRGRRSPGTPAAYCGSRPHHHHLLGDRLHRVESAAREIASEWSVMKAL
jgi:hypothetical protein